MPLASIGPQSPPLSRAQNPRTKAPLRRFASLLLLLTLAAAPVRAGRFVYEPVSDADDGQLVDGFAWDSKPGAGAADALLSLGQQGASTYDNALAFRLTDLAEGQSVAHVALRLNEQGGLITGGLTVQVTAALTLDPLAVTGAARFGLPRTSNAVFWTVPAAWDSSGQRVAKYEESPDLSPVIQEAVGQSGWDAGTKDVVLFLEVFSALGDNVVRYDDRHGAVPGGNAGMDPARLIVSETFRDAFWGKELLCRPQPGSVEVNVIPHAAADAYVEWGGDGVTFPSSTGTASIAARTAHQFLIDGLTSDTQYHYRLQTRPAGGGAYQAGPVRSFVTLPAAGEEARICLTADIHVTNQLALGLDTQIDLLNDALDFMPAYLAEPYHLWVDLGDLVVIRAQRVVFDLEETEQRYRTGREYVDRAAHSLPFVLIRGNHEEINGWDDDGTPDNSAVWSGNMLLKYFPPPLPDAFVSGNAVPHPNLGLPGNYFAFDIGSLRFRALDPFLFSVTRPHNGHGETGGSLNGWDWTLGQQQYDWLKNDLAGHLSTFSVVGIHHLTSCYTGPGQFYGRGGVEIAKFAVDGRPSFEWGGEDSTGTNVLATKRAGFLSGAPHDLLAGSGNQVLLKGHDHFHARQSLDGMVYVTMAKPDATEEQTGNLWGWRFFSFYEESGAVLLENSGFYSVVANDSIATYSYVQTYPAGGAGTVKDLFTAVTGATGADDVRPEVRQTWIEMVRPNPARAPDIRWQLARAGHVDLAIYDAAGRRVRQLVNGTSAAGPHETSWDGRDAGGARVASGVYFAKLQADGRLDAVKMVILR
jgi:hypothetical protein